MQLKQVVLLFLFLLVFYKIESQTIGDFKLKCDTTNFIFKLPFIHFFSSRIDEEYVDLKTINPINNNYPFTFNISLSKPIFVELVNSPFLIYPNCSLSAILSSYGERVQVVDSNDVNTLLVDYENKISDFKTKYTKESTYKDFLNIYDSLNQFVKEQIKFNNSNQAEKKYKLSSEMKSALNDFLLASLGSFSLYPIYNNIPVKNKIVAIIKRDVRMINPSTWFQLQIAKGFLKNYFINLVLPLNKYDIYKSLNFDPLFKDLTVKKYVVYSYYSSLLNSDTLFKTAHVIIKNIDEFLKRVELNKEDLIAFQKLKYKLQLSGNSITNLIAKQSFQNYNLKNLSIDDKNKLFNGKNVLLYFWASWCRPCLETLQRLKSDQVIINSEKYKIIFLSIDIDETKWQSVKFKTLQLDNSFKITNLKTSSFFKVFNLFRVPRIISIDNGILIDQYFPVEKFKEAIDKNGVMNY